MKDLLYVLVATALVSLMPFLLLFDKECFPNHGLFCYSVLLIFLFYSYTKKIVKKNRSKRILVIITFILVSCISWIDLLEILKLLQKDIGLYGLIPFLTPVIALALLKNVQQVAIRKINLIAFLIFFIHLVCSYTVIQQPILEFSLLKKIRFDSKSNEFDRSSLSEDLSKQYAVLDSTSITKNYIDTSRSNVIILVESWGIPVDKAWLASDIEIFRKSNATIGIHHRNFSHTKKAEVEDLIWRVITDSLKQSDTTFITDYLSSLEFSVVRFEQDVLRKDSIGIDSIASLLDSCAQKKCLITYITADTKFPLQGDITEIEKMYKDKLHVSLDNIAQLARQHPEANYIIQGDHEPILSPMEFQKKFYKRWVPFVVIR